MRRGREPPDRSDPAATHTQSVRTVQVSWDTLAADARLESAEVGLVDIGVLVEVPFFATRREVNTGTGRAQFKDCDINLINIFIAIRVTGSK